MTDSPKKLSVIIPVYYNAESLGELFQRLLALEASLLKRSASLELIFVDDGSGDDSFEVLLDIKRRRPETKLIKLTKNFGEMACSWTGFGVSTGDCVAVLAADLQDPPEQIIPMFEAWEQGCQLVFSHRRSRKDPWLSKLFAAFYYRILDALIVKGFPKGGADLILIDKSLVAYVQRLGIGVNYLLYLYWLGFEAKLLPYDRGERKYGKSRWTFKKKFFYFLDTLTGFTPMPLRLVSALGLSVSLVSLIYGVRCLMSGVETPGLVTLATLISFSAGIIVTMLSLIGEYVWRIFEIVGHHPKSVIAQALLESDSAGK